VQEREQKKERRIGRYVVQEHTARRLVAEARGRPLVTVGVMWGIFLLLAALIAPWRGGSRLFIALATALVLAIVSLLLLHFTPLSRRLTVDVEAAECRVERVHSLSRRAHTVRIALPDVRGVRLRRRVWRDPGDVTKVEWVIEMPDDEGKTWLLAEGDQREPMAELARLTAEVAGCPLEEQ
jgi:hypothetical protein